MSTMKKLLATVGIGAAQVETELHQSRVVPGDTMSATVTIKGGDVAQTVENVYLHIVGSCRYVDDGRVKYRSITFGRHLLTGEFTIQPGEVQVTETSFQLSYETPLTIGGNSVYVRTGLDIPVAFDPTDKDAIEVAPGSVVQAMFDAMNALGFRLHKADCEIGYRKYGQNYVQEFEFKPLQEPFRSKLDEVELICLPSATSVQVYIQVDRRARSLGGLLAEAFDVDETFLKLTVTQQDVPTLREMLSQTILTHAR